MFVYLEQEEKMRGQSWCKISYWGDLKVSQSCGIFKMASCSWTGGSMPSGKTQLQQELLHSSCGKKVCVCVHSKAFRFSAYPDLKWIFLSILVFQDSRVLENLGEVMNPNLEKNYFRFLLYPIIIILSHKTPEF